MQIHCVNNSKFLPWKEGKQGDCYALSWGILATIFWNGLCCRLQWSRVMARVGFYYIFYILHFLLALLCFFNCPLLTESYSASFKVETPVLKHELTWFYHMVLNYVFSAKEFYLVLGPSCKANKI